MRSQAGFEKAHDRAIDVLSQQNDGRPGAGGLACQEGNQFAGVLVRTRVGPERVAQSRQFRGIRGTGAPDDDGIHAAPSGL
jgi:hypothetical protein